MNQTEIERLVIDALTADAETAMKTTNDTEQLQTFLDTTEQDTRRRRRLVVSLAVAAAAVAAVAVVVWPRSDPDAGGPVGSPDANGEVSEAEQTATDFFDALSSFDREGAASYVAPGAQLTLPVVMGNEGSVIDWTLRNRWDQATGWTVTDLAGCEEGVGGSAAQVEVNCTFTAHQLGSDELDRGPFGGNVLIVTVRDGAVVGTRLSSSFSSNGFAAEMWEPFWAWMDQAHPSDAALMATFEDPDASAARVDRSLRLWQTRTEQYVAAVNAGDAD